MLEVLVYALLLAVSVSAIAFLAIWVRGRILEQRLALLDALAELGQRVAQLEHAIHASEVAPLERKMEGLADSVKAVERRIAVLGTVGTRGPQAQAAQAQTPEEAVLEVLERRGFHPVRISGAHVLESGPLEIKVEAWRQGVPVKGSVLFHNGAVSETRLTPLYELFP